MVNRIILATLIMLFATRAQADLTSRITVQGPPPMDKAECLKNQVQEHIWKGLRWDETAGMCYAEISTSRDTVTVYITKDYHLIVDHIRHD